MAHPPSYSALFIALFSLAAPHMAQAAEPKQDAQSITKRRRPTLAPLTIPHQNELSAKRAKNLGDNAAASPICNSPLSPLALAKMFEKPTAPLTGEDSESPAQQFPLIGSPRGDDKSATGNPVLLLLISLGNLSLWSDATKNSSTPDAQ